MKNVYDIYVKVCEENYSVSVDGKLKSVYIFNELSKKVDYGTIKLAFAFLDE